MPSRDGLEGPINQSVNKPTSAPNRMKLVKEISTGKTNLLLSAMPFGAIGGRKMG